MKLLLFVVGIFCSYNVNAATPDIFVGKYTLLSFTRGRCPDVKIVYSASQGELSVLTDSGEWMSFSNINGSPYSNTFEGDSTTDQVTFNGLDKITVIRKHTNPKSWTGKSDTIIFRKGTGLVIYNHHASLMDFHNTCTYAPSLAP